MLGIAVGAALAVIFAPQPGTETREKLGKQGGELRKLSQMGLEQLTAQMRERYGDAFTQGREAYGKAKDEVLGRYARAKTTE